MQVKSESEDVQLCPTLSNPCLKEKKKKLQIFNMTKFGYLENILFHYSIVLIDTFDTLVGLKELEKNGTDE